MREAIPDDEAAVEEVSRLGAEALRLIYRPLPASPAAGAQTRLARLVAVAEGRVVGTVRYRRQANRTTLLGRSCILITDARASLVNWWRH